MSKEEYWAMKAQKKALKKGQKTEIKTKKKTDESQSNNLVKLGVFGPWEGELIACIN